MSSLSPQPPPPSRPFYPARQPMHSIPMLLPVFIIFFLFMCFLSIFLFRDLFHYLTALSGANRGPRQDEEPNSKEAGLDPLIISSFPTIPFPAARRLQKGKCGSECAVCLSEFNEGDAVRLLTVCCHAFHPACIDSWLASHTTCPICRSDLKAPPDEAAVLAVREVVGGGTEDSHVIQVEEEVKDLSNGSRETKLELTMKLEHDQEARRQVESTTEPT